MKKFLLIIAACLFCISCGVKDGPKYDSSIYYNKAIYLV